MLRSLAPAALVAAATLTIPVSDASACGGCFVATDVNTQVSSHRMVLSMSLEQTTLWDQIVYVGEPESFAWVLPTRGVVEVGLSADALFRALEWLTVVQVISPPACGLGGEGDAPATAGEKGSGPPSKGSEEESQVEVTAHEVVGPYETVQLSSEDPEALRLWLEQHGYAVPDDVAPLIDDYVLEGFDFLALRLVPGEGVDAMRPVRITSPGANPTLPLRMVAAGTGARTPISLWVLGEGRYQAANMENFLIEEDDLVWDWDFGGSNYAELRAAGFEQNDQRGWLTEVSMPFSRSFFAGQIEAFANGANGSLTSGYDETAPGGAKAQLAEDLEALVGPLDETLLTVTRLGAELSREALSQDLLLEAAPDQSNVTGTMYAKKTTGTEPTCSPQVRDDVHDDVDDGGDDSPLAGGCGVTHSPLDRGALLGLAMILAVWRLGRRRTG